MDDFLESDVQTSVVRDPYLGYVKNVKTGNHSELELTGNAFSVRVSRSTVYIESLWDEDTEPVQLSSDEFSRILCNWSPR